MSELQTISLYLKELSMKQHYMHIHLYVQQLYRNSRPHEKLETFYAASLQEEAQRMYARCFTGISPKYMAKMNKEDRNNFQTAIEEILEDLNLGGHVTAEPLMSERTKEYFDSYKDEAYYSLSPKKRKIVDMQQRGYIDEDGQIDEDAIYDDACEAAEELAVFLRAVFNNPKEDSKKLIKFLDNLWTAGKYKQLQATLIGFELLFEFPEKYLEDVECCLGEARKLFLFAI